MRKVNTESTHYHYSPFLPLEEECKTRTALIVLNSPIRKPPSPLFQRLWGMSSFRICADGGANRLFDSTDGTSSDNLIPDMIRGDLDSLRPEVKDHYTSRSVRVEKDPDQNSNDLDKCLQTIQMTWLRDKHSDYRVCVYGAFGGRFDQEMASIQALFKWRTTLQNKMFLYDDHTCAFLLSEGVLNEIRLPFYDQDPTADDIGDGPTCGLIPLGSPCKTCKTTGLKWNLHGDYPLDFGGLVSTSNRIVENVVTVECSSPLVFTAEVAPGSRHSSIL